MTVLVTVQGAGEMVRLRRYETAMMGGHLCTHEGLYDPGSVTAPNVSAYQFNGPMQDRIAQPGRADVRASRPA